LNPNAGGASETNTKFCSLSHPESKSGSDIFTSVLCVWSVEWLVKWNALEWLVGMVGWNGWSKE